MSANATFWSAIIAPIRRNAAALVLALAVMAGGTAAAQDSPADENDQDALARVEAYMNALSTIQSRFVQANPDGSYSEGTMYLQRPGRLRFEYDPPDPYLIIARGKWLIFIDTDLDHATYLPLEQTPANFIVRENIRFGGKLRVTTLQRSDNVLRVQLEQTDQPDAGRVMLIFTDNPLQLRKWRIVDAQGNLTDTTLINPRYGVALDDSLFIYQEPEVEEVN
jgi:outer membrane lipoprotein-sorting protein